MNIGDKVRVKDHFICVTKPIHKGWIGTINHFDFLGDILFIEFESCMIKIDIKDFYEHLELIKNDPRSKCPDVLKKWFLATEPYLGKKHD